MNPETPVCTCLARPIPGMERLRRIVVFDPYCQIPAHKKQGTYDGPEPVYAKQEESNE